MKSGNSKLQTAMRRPPGFEDGFTMIEVLIAFLILAIGLIGMASLQLTSVKSAHSSYFRSIASSIALDLEEHLWLEVANQTTDGCPDPAAVADRVQTFWNGRLDDDTPWTSNEIATLPGIDDAGAITSTSPDDPIVSPDTTPEGTPFWTEIDFTLNWSEQRFENEGDTEQFRFVGRVACRPAPATI